ncbi:hypothetical protein [Actinophytocola oryzae]|uniref:Nucleotide exchange factor GrpE n=1 Tax=Actinophytocola oryzae TaxID=502181 RepID=A0A4R7URG9_9PSEU|nr:hypothetical protein [Actinophytocola oryzae]TDV35436.1 hypothetical protein CLV71_13423 [Actinophytocola oryzae]
MSRQLARLRAELRQRRHHRAFRIPPPVWDEPVRAQLAGLIAATKPSGDPRSELDDRALAAAVTDLWHAERKLGQPTENPLTLTRQATRYLRGCRRMLADAGLVIQDHDGDLLHHGRSITVLVSHEDPALTDELVLETVKPTIYLRDRRIQKGEVIVGRPPSGGATRHDTDPPRGDHA